MGGLVKDVKGIIMDETEGVEQFLLDANEFFRVRLEH
jgi:hypothetical protein